MLVRFYDSGLIDKLSAAFRHGNYESKNAFLTDLIEQRLTTQEHVMQTWFAGLHQNTDNRCPTVPAGGDTPLRSIGHILFKIIGGHFLLTTDSFNTNNKFNTMLKGSERAAAKQSETHKDKDAGNKYIYSHDAHEYSGDHMEKVKVNISVPKTNNSASPQLSSEEQNRFKTLTKIGVYKELYKKNMLTQAQLSSLLKIQNNDGAFNEEMADMEHDTQHKRKNEPMEM